ncbi:hypothetical protein [Actinoplanes sp. L3-i22]|uniref:hypothetical protein n=1 Tax=Actinoplanes sp. L3-i22 TaxID=2836373 RepID=UPI001C772BDA|nr:hypothetical protein [Actinoplanes sp. L3-i22]BCY09921.1 hypothetical protein L3i22_050090 [Actinoplanes sp. L3-i22]
MEPHKDPAQPADAAAPEGLEGWLRDLRTEVAADPTGWADPEGDPAGEPPAPPAPTEARGGGRHRAAD